ncbi:AAA family ATPase [Lactobacillus sp. PV012]|uniref:AAA family ATPase n=1 Tax=Lactobacillus sp. PV012 TaxID=2594494 RepID=UPI00223F38B7|nr:AAA family ATPase [Lactobacillus sp. PV012]QNQ81956.1 AAA family ATPase [Lactobacillus sp. PV012]
MKLTKINILNFGKLSNINFELTNNLSIFEGNNEAGKSTTVAFIKQILFGFYLKTRHTSFFENYEPKENKGLMGGSLTFKDGENEFELTRTYKKGDSKKGNLVVNLNGEQIPENVFFDRLQNIDGDFYTDSFIFNQDLLRQVTSLDEEQLLERIYFLGAAESNKFLQLRDSFKKESELLFKKKGRKPEINQLLTQIEEQKVKLSGLDQEFENYRNLENELNTQAKNKRKLTDEAEALQKQQLKYGHLNTQLENYRSYQELEEKKEKVNFSPEALQDAKNLEVQLETLKNNLAQLINNQAINEKNDLDQLDELEKVLNKRVNYLQWKSILTKDEQNISQAKNKIAQIKEYNPEIQKILSLSPQQRKDLKKEYDFFQKQSSDNYGNQEKYLTMFGLTLSVLGILLALTISPACWLLVLFGGASLGYGYFQKRKRDDQKLEFEEKYNLDPSKIALDLLLSKVLEVSALEDDIAQTNLEINQVNTQLTNYLAKLGYLSKKEVTPSNAEFILDELSTKINSFSKSQQLAQEQERQIFLLKNKINEYEKKLNDLLLSNKVSSIKQLEELGQKVSAQEEIQVKEKALANLLKEDLETLQEINSNLPAFREKQEEVGKKLKAVKQQLEQEETKLAEIKVEMSSLATSDKLFQEKQKLANLKTQVKEKSTEYLADLLVSAWISRGLDLASNERFPKMLNNARNYFKLLTGEQYINIEIGKKIKVKNKNGKKFEAEFLSRGTREQLYFALKLAFVEQVYDKIALPILIDDAFVNFDEQRTEYIIELLKKLTQKAQVLIFTQKKQLGKALGIEVLNFKKKEV